MHVSYNEWSLVNSHSIVLVLCLLQNLMEQTLGIYFLKALLRKFVYCDFFELI